MSDLIDRQAAIDAIDYWYGIDASEALSRLPSAHRWIPCSERMPEIDETVLITIKDKYDGDKEYHYHTDVADHLINDGWMTFNDWDEGQELEIVAWMPLPDPYRGGGEI